MFPSLSDFVRTLEARGELRRITVPVSPLLQPAAVADAHARRPAPSSSPAAGRFDPGRAALGGEALLFEHVEGCDLPLAMNLFGSYRRMEMALGCDVPDGFEAIAGRLGSLVKPEPPRNLAEIVGKVREVLPLLRVPPKRRRSGPSQQVVRLTERGEVDLRRLPLIRCWPLDGDPAAVGFPMTAEAAGTAAGQGRYVTFAGMHTIHADDRGAAKPASHNIGMYRAQLVDATHLAMHWHVHHDGAAHWRSWKKLGEPMPIAIAFGGESVLPYAATCPLPPGIGELLMAGFLNGSGIPLVRAVTVPLRVPANSEVVIEGWVRTDAGPIGWDPAGDEPLGPGAVFEGPFGDHTGFYSLPDRYPLVEVTAITHRRDAILPATVVGPPPQEDYYLGKATERIMLPLLKTVIHDIEDYHLPRFGCFHNAVFIRIAKAYPLHARRVMHAVWGAVQMAWTKLSVVVDRDVDVHDEDAVLAAIFEHADFRRDVELVNGPLDILDHAAPRLGAGHKIGFDATPVRPGEEVGGVSALPPGRASIDVVRSGVSGLAGRGPIAWTRVPAVGGGRWIVAGVDKDGPGHGGEAIESVWGAVESESDLVLAVDAGVDGDDTEAILFALASHADPGRDRHERGRRLAFDATAKVGGDERHGQPVRAWPPPLSYPETVRAWMDEHAAALGLAANSG